MASSSVWNPATSEKFEFSPNCQDWALTTNDGRLVVWDSDTGRSKQEFVPSSHLSSACTCLAWIPENNHETSRRKSRKRKSSLTNGSGNVTNGDSSHMSDVVAVGTSSGAVFIYSIKTGDIQAQFSADKAHSDRINDIVWNSACSQIFTASSDGCIGHFSIKKSLTLGKYRVNESSKSDPIYSVCVHPNDESIFAGSFSKITWIDLDTKSPLLTFAGAHLGAVNLLKTVVLTSDVCYLVSAGASEQDHILSVWDLQLEKTPNSDYTAGSVVARFGVNETVRSFSVSSTDEFGCTLAAVTISGALLCFDHTFSEKSMKKKKKPIKPRATIQIASEKHESGKVKSIPILDARLFGEDNNLSVKIVYGSHTRPVFEGLAYDSLDTLTCLVRQQVAQAHHQTLTAGSSNLVVPKTGAAHILAPGPTLVDNSITLGGVARKRKQSIGDNAESLAMVDRLRLLSKEGDNKTTPPRANSMLQLLLQGLNNKDRKILSSVLDRADEDLIEKTVRKLPVEAIMPLVGELQHYIKGRGMVNQSHAKWLRYVLQIHTAHLMSNPECPEILGPVYAMLEARTKHYTSLLMLKGKLDMMTRQIVATADDESNAQPAKEALLVYQDDSSDELSEVLDDLLLPPSDTEDIWHQDTGDDLDESDTTEDESEEDQNFEQIEVSDESDGEGKNGLANGNGSDVSMD